MTALDTSSNLAARALFDAAVAADLTNYRIELDSVPDSVASALVVWATQRNVPVDSIEERGGTLEYGGRTVYCFLFGSGDLAEDSRVSLCPST
ncbi:MAG TPA: hypothetical protein VKT72_02880 [Candidatus Baltobacteraceae bacterium]|nr:hypothetical protein [Candidatus Baltobacteraceae bacterium]